VRTLGRFNSGREFEVALKKYIYNLHLFNLLILAEIKAIGKTKSLTDRERFNLQALLNIDRLQKNYSLAQQKKILSNFLRNAQNT